MPTLSVDAVSHSYGSRPALRDVSWGVTRGVHGLLGPNGAGKSTLLSIMAGLVPAQTGTVMLDGAPVAGRKGLRDVRGSVNYLPQGFGYPPSFTVIDYVLYGLWVKGYRGDPMRAARAAVSKVGLQEEAGTRLSRLSGGMLQRAGIAQAISGSPRAILLDEPTVGLDPQQRLELRELLCELGTECAVALSTHIAEDIEYTCDDVTVLNHGQVEFVGTVTTLQARSSGSSAGRMSNVEAGYLAVLSDVEPRRSTP